MDLEILLLKSKHTFFPTNIDDYVSRAYNNLISAMNKDLVETVRDLPPHLRLYAERYITKTPLNAESSVYACTKHGKGKEQGVSQGKARGIGGMKKGFLCSKKEQLDNGAAASDVKLGYQDPID